LKKYTIYILLGTSCIVIALLLFSRKQQKVIDKRVTLVKSHKIPYGTNVAFNLVPTLFPGSAMETNKKSPTDWFESDKADKGNSLFFLLSKQFNPNEEEMLVLNRFVSKGNSVFISSPRFGNVALEFFGFQASYNVLTSDYDKTSASSSSSAMLRKPFFSKDTSYTYPGYSFKVRLQEFNKGKFLVIGTDKEGYPNFIRADVGLGSFYIHSDPLFFSNYFLLHGNNKDYLEKSLSIVPSSVKNIIWDEYYIHKKEGKGSGGGSGGGRENNSNDSDSKPRSPLSILLDIPAFWWAFWLAVILFLLYLLLNSKRNQRLVPIVTKPKNESLDFVNVIGRLYYEKHDHQNLALKMVTYFLEHVRSRYFINTSHLNDEFVKKLSGKSGYDEGKVSELIQAIFIIQTSSNISQAQLAKFYQLFQQFYKHTA
jgi:hypothetical protein